MRATLKIYALLSVCIFVINLSAFSQWQDNSSSIIHYSDGSIFVGQILEKTSNGIKVKLVTGDTLTLQSALIRKIRFAEDIYLYSDRKFHFNKGNFTVLSGGFAVSGNGAGYGDIYIGKRLNDRLSLGLGTGYHSNSTTINNIGSFWGTWINTNTIPITLNAQYFLNDRMNRLFVHASAGYGILVEDSWNSLEGQTGGPLVQLGFGYEFASRRNYKYFLQLDQNFQYDSGRANDFDILGFPVQTEFNIWYQRIGLTVGIKFF